MASRDIGATQLTPPRGTIDYPPPSLAALSRVLGALENVLEHAGYPAVRTPMFERFGLLAMRAGDAIRHSMFTFTSERVEYALRPEMTTPIGRMVASGLLTGPLPRRVRYAAPCFRYERPGSRRQREFTQVGAELFDSPAPWGDVEMIILASECARAVDGDRIHLRVGDIRVFGSQLAGLNAEARGVAANLLNDALAVEARCAGLREVERVDDALATWLRDLVAGVFRLQQRVGSPTDETIALPSAYTPDTVAALARELPRASRDATRLALVSMAGLDEVMASRLVHGTTVQGTIGEVAEAGRSLFGDSAAEALESLQQVYALADAAGARNVEASLGVARGLEFYTGTVFAVVVPEAPGAPVVGGGGRYDHLIEELGGPTTPAVGFAVEVEQILALLGHEMERPEPATVVVVAAEPSAWVRAAELSGRLRAAGLRAPLPQPHSPTTADGPAIVVPSEGPYRLMLRGETSEAADFTALLTQLRAVCETEAPE